MQRKGFTLIELMIVVSIVAFLAVVSVPSFMRFLAKAKRAEVYMQLSSLYTAQKAYWAENGTYSNDLKKLGWIPEGYKGGGTNERFYYTYGFPGAEGANFVTGNLQTPSSYLGAAHVGKNSFVAVAVGDIRGNGTPDILTVNEYNDIRVVQDALAR